MKSVLIGVACFYVATASAQASLSPEDALGLVAIVQNELGLTIEQEFGRPFTIEFNPATGAGAPPVVAAAASRDSEGWYVTVLGSAPLHPRLTRDAFMVLLCHELGHHFGGAPFKRDDQGAARWSSLEGQADYYATAVCAKHFLDEVALSGPDPLTAQPDVARACLGRTRSQDEARLCARAILAAQSYVEAMANADVPWTAVDPTVVTRNWGVDPDPQTGAYAYPSYACRMQTLRQGALCQQVAYPSVSDVLGTASHARYCAGDRPACWFKSE